MCTFQVCSFDHFSQEKILIKSNICLNTSLVIRANGDDNAVIKRFVSPSSGSISEVKWNVFLLEMGERLGFSKVGKFV